MGRRNIVSQRITEILEGKLLRFTAIHDEYKKRFKKVAYKQVADNLKLLRRKGIVSCIAGNYFLTKDSADRGLMKEKIQLARESSQIFLRKMEETVRTLEQTTYFLAVARIIEIPLDLVWDKRKIQKLIIQQKGQLKQLQKILEENV